MAEVLELFDRPAVQHHLSPQKDKVEAAPPVDGQNTVSKMIISICQNV